MRIPVLWHVNRLLTPPRRRLRARWLASRGRHEDAVVSLSKAVPGWFHQEEIRQLYRTVRKTPGPGEIAEIGSWKGRSTVVIGRALQDANQTDCRVFAIDPHEGSDGYEQGSTLAAFRANVKRAGVDRLIEEMVMRSEEAAAILAERAVRLRLAFIDGAHDEESVRTDIRCFLPLMRPGGILVFHDCVEGDGGWPSVWKAYESEAAPHVRELARAKSLLVTQLR